MLSKVKLSANRIIIAALAEQHHIVTRVDELMALCAGETSGPEAQLAATINTRCQLLEATLYKLLSSTFSA